MGKKIIVIGTLDTKGEQIQYLRDQIESRGHNVVVMDLSIGGTHDFQVEISSKEIADLMGMRIEELIASKDRYSAAKVMTYGAQKKITEILPSGQIDGVVAIGGLTVALIASRIMSKLPFGIPKIIATTVAYPGVVEEWFDAMDIGVIQLIMDVAGMNNFIMNSITQVAGAISGMVEKSLHYTSLKPHYPAIAITEHGLSEKCGSMVRKLLMSRGYNVYTFHAQGISERCMERMIREGLFEGIIDIVTGGVIQEVFEGINASGPDRLEAACERGIPQILAPSNVNITGCGPPRKHRERYSSRTRQLKMDDIRILTRFNIEELSTGAKVYAEKLNKANGPVEFLFPLKGWSSFDGVGSILHDPEEDRIFIEELKKQLKPEIKIKEIDCNLEDPEFAEALVDCFDKIYKEKGVRSPHATFSRF